MAPSDLSSNLTSSKSSFVTSQVRLLSQPLHDPSVNTLPDAATEKLISVINKKITSYNRLHFGLESQRHVVEQIGGIYWRDVLAGGLPVRKAETTVQRDVDFTESEKVLPEQWEDVVLDERPRKRRRTEDRQREQHNGVTEAGTEKNIHELYEDTDRASQQEEPQARAYAELRERLRSQNERRDELRRKLGQYKKLRGLLTPFEKPQDNIQPNLVTRDNKELEAELAKMRVLLARVGRGIQSQQHQTQAQHHEAIRENVMTDAKKLEAVLGLG